MGGRGNVHAAMVLCAGKGTRLRPLTDELAKPMVPVGDEPALAQVVARVRLAVAWESSSTSTIARTTFDLGRSTSASRCRTSESSSAPRAASSARRCSSAGQRARVERGHPQRLRSARARPCARRRFGARDARREASRGRGGERRALETTDASCAFERELWHRVTRSRFSRHPHDRRSAAWPSPGEGVHHWRRLHPGAPPRRTPRSAHHECIVHGRRLDRRIPGGKRRVARIAQPHVVVASHSGRECPHRRLDHRRGRHHRSPNAQKRSGQTQACNLHAITLSSRRRRSRDPTDRQCRETLSGRALLCLHRRTVRLALRRRRSRRCLHRQRDEARVARAAFKRNFLRFGRR